MNDEHKKKRRRFLYVILGGLMMVGLIGVDTILTAGDQIWYHANDTNQIMINSSYNSSTVYINHDMTFGWKDTDDDGIVDTPSTILLDAPSARRISTESSILKFESSTENQSNNLILESKDNQTSDYLQFKSVYNSGYCTGTPTCIRTICSSAACASPCNPLTLGCVKGTRKCTSFIGCNYETQLECQNVAGCSWIGSITNATSTLYTDDDSDATIYTDDDSDATLYQSIGSLVINMSNGLTESSSTFTDAGKWITPGGYATTNDIFVVDETQFYWDDGNGASLYVVPSDGVYVYGVLYSEDQAGLNGIVDTGSCNMTFTNGLLTATDCGVI